MDEEQKAKALSEYLDALLQGEASELPAAADKEIEALGELGRSLIGIGFRPRSPHQTTVERLLQEHRPVLRTGGATVSRIMLWGIPLRWLLGLIALLAGGLAAAGVGALAGVIPVLNPGTPTPGFTAPLRGLEMMVSSVMVPATPLTAAPLRMGRTPTTAVVPTTTATLTPTVTITPTVTVTPTATVTPTVAVTPTVTITPSSTVTSTPAITVTPTVTVTPISIVAVIPTPTITITVTPTPPAMSGLAFHPTHLNAGGRCRESYSASGSLKNHGTSPVTNVRIDYEVINGDEWVKRVRVTSSNWAVIGTSKPGRFRVYVYTNGDWASSGKGAVIKVRLFVVDGEGVSVGRFAEAIFTVKSQCEAEQSIRPPKPEKQGTPAKPEKPDKPDKSEKDKPDKPEKDKPDKPEKDKPDRPEKDKSKKDK